MSLSSIGWNAKLIDAFRPYSIAGLIPARVALQHKNVYEVLTAQGEFNAACTGRLLHASAGRAELPAVGDWVAVNLRPNERHADIHAVLPRRTKFSRRAPGDENGGSEQIIATNVDTVFLVSAFDQNYNLRRIERYLAVAWESGAQPVVILNKSDLHPDPAIALREVESIAIGAPVIAVSVLARCESHPTSSAPAIGSELPPPSRFVLAALGRWLIPGQTIAFLGSSGVGKSTLINCLLGTDRQRTNPISDAVAKGRHTTTHRELIVAPAGFLVIDTPGMRELQLWDTPETVIDRTFSDIRLLAARCRFTDCSHGGEPGCAVQAALADGTLEVGRWQSHQKLQREQAYAARKADPRLAQQTKNRWKKIHRSHRAAARLDQDDL